MDEETQNDNHEDNEAKPRTSFFAALFGLDPRPRRDDENSGWLIQQVSAHSVSRHIMSVVALAIHLLIIGAIWHWLRRRGARADQSVEDPAMA